MKFDTAWFFYRSNRAIAKAANVTDQAVNQWKAKGVIPFLSAMALQAHSHGAIKMDPKVYVARKKKTARE